MTSNTHAEEDVQVHVSFAAAPDPFNHSYPDSTVAGTVLQNALANFGVTPDGATRYFFVFNGAELTGAETLASLIEHGRSLKLSLRTETISG